MDEAPERPESGAVIDTLVANHRRFLSFLERRVGDRALAEDILQDAFSRGLEKVPALRKEEAAIGWFYRVLKNAIIDRARRSGTSQSALSKLAAEMEHAEAPAEALRVTVCACVTDLARNLKPEYAEALKRIEIDGVSVKEYASEAGLTSGNAAVRVFRAREALRKQVVRSCATCAEHGCFDCHCKS